MVTETNTDRAGQFAGQSGSYGSFGSSAGSMGDKVSDMAGQASGYATRAASALASEAQEKAKGMLQQQIGAGADYVRMISDTAHSAARELENKAPELAKMVHDAARRAEELAEDIRHRSVNDIIDQATSLARNNPRMFLGGAVAIGFLLSRFIKSSAQNIPRRYEPSHGSRDFSAPSGGAGAGSSSSGGASTPRTSGGASYAG